MVILALLEEVCDILQINPYSTQTYKDYIGVVNPGTGLKLAFSLANSRPIINDSYIVGTDGTVDMQLFEVEQMWWWLKADELPKDFRSELTRYLCQRDQLEEHIAELSQVRYERLRQWTNYHV